MRTAMTPPISIRIAPAAALLALSASTPTSAQQYDYPDPFPGGYPNLSGSSGAGRMYMESYFPPPVTASPTYPAWSPDGESIAFAYQGRIWVVPVEGGTARQVTSGPGYHSQPSWSPDGAHIAYAADIDRNFDIFVVEVGAPGSGAAGEPRRLTTHPFLDLRPRWSPDGGRILFTTERDGTFDLWAYDMERGQAEAVIADPQANDMAGDWVGSTGDIVFVSRRGQAALGSGSLWRWRSGTGEAELLLRIETNYQAAPVVAPAWGHRLLHHRLLREQRHLRRPQREVAPRHPARAADAHAHGRILPVVVATDGEHIVYARNGGTDDQPRTIDSGMGFGLYIVTRGGGAPRPVRIDDYAWSEPTGQVRVRVTDSAGELLPSRVYLTGADGRAYFPHSSYPRVVSVTEDYYFHSDGSFTATLPVGEATLEAWRGFEYEPVSRSVDVRAGRAPSRRDPARPLDRHGGGWLVFGRQPHPSQLRRPLLRDPRGPAQQGPRRGPQRG